MKALHDNDVVHENETVTTSANGTVILLFSNGATVSITEDSELNIEEFEQDPFTSPTKISDMKKEPTTSVTKLNMTRGEMVGKVAHLNVDGGSEFTINTPVGAAGIRGTTFQIKFRLNKDGTATFSLRTADGIVTFRTVALPVPVAVPAGKEILTVTTASNSGAGTASSPTAANLQVTNIPAADLAIITQAAQTIVDAVSTSTVVIATTTNTTTTTNPTTGTTTTTTTTTNNTPADTPQSAPRTTSGDGG